MRGKLYIVWLLVFATSASAKTSEEVMGALFAIMYSGAQIGTAAIKAGADVSIANTNGKTAVELAKIAAADGAMKAVTQAQISAMDTEAKKEMFIAAENGKTERYGMLLDAQSRAEQDKNRLSFASMMNDFALQWEVLKSQIALQRENFALQMAKLLPAKHINSAASLAVTRTHLATPTSLSFQGYQASLASGSYRASRLTLSDATPVRGVGRPKSFEEWNRHSVPEEMSHHSVR